MKSHASLRMIRWLAGAFCALAFVVAAHPAAPTIQWNTTLYHPFPTPNGSGWYQAVQAIASDTDGDLAAVRVDYLNPSTNSWTAFAWNGGGNGYTNSSDNNFIQAVGSSPNYGAQTFRAQASDGASNTTPFIYLVVKPNGTAFTIDDLPVEPATSRRFMPNAGHRAINSRILGGVLNNLGGKSGYTVWFKDGTYDFDTGWERRMYNSDADFETYDYYTWNTANNLSADEAAKCEETPGGQIYYHPGTLGRISGCSDITFKAENTGSAVLQWASYSSHGTLSPASGELYGLASGDSRYTHPTDPRPWPLPGPFITVESSAYDIVFDGLEFEGSYALKTTGSRADNGSHLRISGGYTQVQNCGFAYSPGWSITVAGAQDTHLDANTLHNGSGDGINLQDSDGSWIVGNVITNVGDDAIVLTGDDNHAIWNYIQQGGWRAFLVHSSTDSEIAYNTVVSTAGFGVEVSPFEGSQTPATSGLTIANNAFSGIGSWTKHHEGAYESSRSIIVLGLTSGVTIEDNTLTRYTGSSGGSANDWGVRVTSDTNDQNATAIRSNNTFSGFSTGTNDVIVIP